MKKMIRIRNKGSDMHLLQEGGKTFVFSKGMILEVEESFGKKLAEKDFRRVEIVEPEEAVKLNIPTKPKKVTKEDKE